ncbi:MAG TPA: COX15/CtaA family protein [Tepidisphaeraceae bacterium]|jgi:cytochrome c oxidase assembly protein subunit 15
MQTTLNYQRSEAPSRYRRSIHFVAMAITLSVFPLIWMGGLVTSHGAGMSVPDWPNSYGYNMFLFPPNQWLGGIFFEHTHRLLGTLSGFLSIILVLLAWGPSQNLVTRKIMGWLTFLTLTAAVVTFAVRPPYAGMPMPSVEDYDAKFAAYEAAKNWSHVYVGLFSLGLVTLFAWIARTRESRRWLRWLTIGQLVAIIFQGLLGGLRVTEVSIELAMIHACFAQLFFCTTAFTALALSHWWKNARDLSRENDAPVARRVVVWMSITAGLIFAQLIVGAIMRHNNAGLAIPDLPLHYGKLLPPTDGAGLEAANAARVWQYHLEPTTLAGIWTHFGHRLGAVLITLTVAVIGFSVLRKLPQRRAIRRVVAILVSLVIVQVTLGILTVLWMKPADVASLHVAVGALTFLTTTQAGIVLARQFARPVTVTERLPREALVAA